METAVEVKFLTTPIPAPGGSQTRYTGGRLTYYGAAEIEPAAAAVPNVSVRQNDVVQVAPAAGAANNGDEPFLAQVEAFWEDSFTGIAYCRARWLVRASEVPRGTGERDIPDDEVLLTTVANDIEAANILGLAPVKTKPGPEPKEDPCLPEAKPEPEAAPAAVRTRRGLRPKVCGRSRPGLGGRGSGRRSRSAATLYLSRSFDPFSADLDIDLAVLPSDHPVLVRLRERERAESGGGGTGREKGRGRLAHVKRDSYRKRWDVAGRAGVERKGLRGARLAVATRRQRSNSTSSRSSNASTSSGNGGGGGGSGGGGYSSSTGSDSVSVGGDSDNSSSISNGGFTSEDSQDDLLDDEEVVRSSYPRGRGGRRGRRQATASSAPAPTTVAVSSTKTELMPARSSVAPKTEPETSPSVSIPGAAVRAEALPARPRRLAMPPDDITLVSESGSTSGNTSSGSSSSSSNGSSASTAEAQAAAGRKSILRGGPLVRAAHAGDEFDPDNDGLDSPKVEQYPQKETNIGEDHQVAIPAMLTTEAERAADREASEASGELGGTLVWASVRDWTPDERERLDGYVEQARLVVDARRMVPGVPALVNTNTTGDRRRKRRMAWAVVAEGEQPEDGERLRVRCAAGPEEEEALEVSRDAVQPVQVGELALQTLMLEGSKNGKGARGSLGGDDLESALGALKTKPDDLGPLATWTGPQLASLSEALEANFDYDRYSRSRGHDRHRDEHTDITSLINCVDGKTPSQVLSFYYRYMATGGALSDEIVGSEAVPVKTRPERKSTRPRTPPPSRPNPSPNLRHRPSLRCPTRLAPSPEDSDSGDSGNSYQPRARRSSKSDRRGGVVSGSGSGKRNGGGAAATSSNSAGGGRPATRQCVDRRAAVPEERSDPCGRRGESAAAAPYGRPRAIGRSSTASLEEGYGADGGRSSAWVREHVVPKADGGGRGCKRPLDDGGGPEDGGRVRVDRVSQRPRWQQQQQQEEGSRPAIPADAVIVEVSDDDDPMAAAAAGGGPHYSVDVNTGLPRGRGGASEVGIGVGGGARPVFVGRAAGTEAGARRASVQPPARFGLDHHHPHRAAGRSYPHQSDDHDHNVASDDTGRHVDDHYMENREAASAAAAVGGGGGGGPRRHHYDHRYADYPYADYDRAAAGGYGYGYGGYSYPRSPAAYSLAPMRGPQQRPDYGGDWTGGGVRGRGGFAAGSGMGGLAGGYEDGYGSRRPEDLTPMEQCWLLVEEAQQAGLPRDRVQYLQGLLRTHERKSMTFQMLAERTDSCLYDRPDIQNAFLGIFGQMNLPGTRRRTYRHDAAPGHDAADYPRSSGGHVLGSAAHPYSIGADRSPPYHHRMPGGSAGGAAAASAAVAATVSHDDGAEREGGGAAASAAVAAGAASTARLSSPSFPSVSGHGRHSNPADLEIPRREERLLHPPPRQGHHPRRPAAADGGRSSSSPPPVALSDMHGLGEGTSMRKPSGDSIFANPAAATTSAAAGAQGEGAVAAVPAGGPASCFLQL